MATMGSSDAELLEDEWYIVRHSGETPEIAFHSALYFLTRFKDGPRLSLTKEQVAWLRQAAVDRYFEIIVRDLQQINYGTSIYRGINRSIINYRRFCTFCDRQKLDRSAIQRRAAAVLLQFLEIEVAEVKGKKRRPRIDCTLATLKSFAADLGLEDLEERFAELAALCADGG
jgi:hypothetical protein